MQASSQPTSLSGDIQTDTDSNDHSHTLAESTKQGVISFWTGDDQTALERNNAIETWYLSSAEQDGHPDLGVPVMASCYFVDGSDSEHPTMARLKIQYMGGRARSFLTRSETGMPESHAPVTEESDLPVLVSRPRDSSEDRELLQVGTQFKTSANSLRLSKVCLWKYVPSELSEARGIKAERDPRIFIGPNEYGILGFVKYDSSVLSE